MPGDSLYGLTFPQLAAWLEEHGYSNYHAEQTWRALYQQRVDQFAQMEGVRTQVRELLEANFSLGSLSLHIKQESADGTVKFLFRLADGNLIETVLMQQKYGLSACVTTQVGCNLGCSFCASGLLTKSRDLRVDEIVEQAMAVQRYLDERSGEKLSNLVVMGIGEPFDNFTATTDFIRIMIDPKGLAIGPRHITVSTSGLDKKIREFADLTDVPVNLAVSLHAPNNELRSKIMKINRAIPIERLMDAVDYYLQQNNRKVTLAYILLRGINDQPQHAEELVQLLQDKRSRIKVNLIPYNPVDEYGEYQRSEQEDLFRFIAILKQNDVSCSVRLEHGTDIDAACGQLRSKQMRASG